MSSTAASDPNENVAQSEFEREWNDLDPQERSQKALDQNKRAQEEARRQIEEQREKDLQAQRDAVGQPQTTSTRGMTFQEAAKRLEETPQPPNPFNAKELEAEQPATTAPPAEPVP